MRVPKLSRVKFRGRWGRTIEKKKNDFEMSVIPFQKFRYMLYKITFNQQVNSKYILLQLVNSTDNRSGT